MKNLKLLLLLVLTPLLSLADVVREPFEDIPIPYQNQFLIVGILAIAALLFVRYRRRRKKE
ncbi:MAG: LPXTG cell wall anchor domain-containing protein [Spirosomataceae bacterium]